MKTEKSIATEVFITFLALIITLINFMFNCKNYLQLRGCAMGVAYTPSYANIFMAKFEQTHIYPFIKNKVNLYLRCTDNIVFYLEGYRRRTGKFL